MGTLATRLKAFRQQALLTEAEIAARLKRRFPLLTEEEITERAKQLVGYEASLTQSELAKRTQEFRCSGLDRTMIGKIESGRRSNPSLETLDALAKALSMGPGPAVLIDDLVASSRENESILLRRIEVKVQNITDEQTLKDILNYIEFKVRR